MSLRLVLMESVADFEPQFGTWEADCPFCYRWVYGSVDAAKEVNRKVRCDFCEKDFHLLYPDELASA